MDIGDVVHLKSGGAGMTVANAAMENDPHSVVCMWHDGNGAPHVERYSEAMLIVKAHAKEPTAKK